MKSLAGCFIAALLASCSRAPPEDGDVIDLLLRRPEGFEGSGSSDRTDGVQADVAESRVRLEPGASVRYRLEPLASGDIRLEAWTAGQGTLEAEWVAIDRATGAEEPRASSALAPDEDGRVARVLPWPAGDSLLELRLAWRARDGALLELRELELCESTPAERPSILLITIDTLSAEHLPFHGYPLDTAPELERFAAESYLFEQCLANAAWTVPSFMSLFTGLHARANEPDDPGAELWERFHVAPNRWTLAEYLRAAGYRTAGFVDSLWLTEEFGLAQGFDVYDASAGEETGPDGGIRRTTQQALGFLEGLAPDTPSFVFVHALDVHGPYMQAPPLAEAPAEAEPYDLERTAPAGGPTVAYGIIPTYIARSEVPDGAIPERMPTAPLERNYDHGIRFVDGVLGEFFDRLRASGHLERTWVIVTADHGETMSDGDYLFGHGVLDQEVVHVPLLIRPPGGLAGGRRIRDTVHLLDLYPTLVSLTGAAPKDQLQGRSLWRLMAGEQRPPRVVLTEGGGIMRQAMLVTDGWKLIERHPALDVVDSALVSTPGLTREWYAETERRLRRGRVGNASVRARNLFGWKDDLELQADLFERLPATGLTEELLERMRARAGFASLIGFLRAGLGRRVLQLYHLEVDPRAERDVAALHPQKVKELLALLRREQERGEAARANALVSARAVELPLEHIRQLEALGYGGDR